MKEHEEMTMFISRPLAALTLAAVLAACQPPPERDSGYNQYTAFMNHCKSQGRSHDECVVRMEEWHAQLQGRTITIR